MKRSGRFFGGGGDIRLFSLFLGKRIHVQVSKSRPRGGPEDEEYPPPPGRGGYYPPHFPGDRPEPPYGERMPGYPPLPPPPPPPRRAPYPDRGYGDADPYGMVDYYEKYRARPYSVGGFDDRRPSSNPPPPPPPSALVRERLGMGGPSPYDRPPPAPSAYMARDRSPIRRAPPPPAMSATNGYPYERSRLSPLARPPMYPAPMFATPRPRDPFSDGTQPPPPPPPPRYAGY